MGERILGHKMSWNIQRKLATGQNLYNNFGSSLVYTQGPPPFLNILKMTFAGFEHGTFSRRVRHLDQLAKREDESFE